MNSKKKKKLEEAEKIFNSIFKASPPPLLKERYVKASEKFSKSFTPLEIAECQRAIKKTSDLEALELASRYLKKLPFLVLKFRIMVFLAEGWPLLRKHYINNKNASLAGLASIFFCGIRTAAKFVKGFFLLTFLKI
jgi:hypothetical protein